VAQLRFLPSIRYGTERYPEKIARRLRAVNLASWIGAVVALCFAIVHFLDPTPGLFKAAVVEVIAASIFALVPFLHRFGPIAGAVLINIFAYAYFFVLLWLMGTGIGMQMLYLVIPGLTFVFFGTERLWLSAIFGVAAALLVIIVEIAVPADTGLLTPVAVLGSFVAATVTTFTVLMATVFYALREAARAEENLAREKEQVQDKSRQLEIANTYKSHFLASASHDLRQPLHALNLFVAQLQGESNPAERSRLVSRIDAAVGSMNELFESLLDMTKLEAGILKPNFSEISVARLLERVETTFANAARKKGLRLRVVESSAWVSSDPILLERILLNLVSNAVRYTEGGGVLVGCRRHGKELRIDVCDTGAGIPEDERQRIFGEFYRLAGTDPDRSGGLGLGLAIVDRLGHLLGHAVELDSRLGCGSRFSVTMPLITQARTAEVQAPSPAIADPARGKRVILIDDDALVLDGMRGILQGWGRHVETAASGAAALASLAETGEKPDLIISDYRLAGGDSGIEAIACLRAAVGAPVPAFVITGDTAPERLREASAGGFLLLHKPVSPMALRTALNRVLKSHDARRLPPPLTECDEVREARETLPIHPGVAQGQALRPR
jgi:signal transduction histidine kinase/FixJ family two-component response regulator